MSHLLGRLNAFFAPPPSLDPSSPLIPSSTIPATCTHVRLSTPQPSFPSTIYTASNHHLLASLRDASSVPVYRTITDSPTSNYAFAGNYFLRSMRVLERHGPEAERFLHTCVEARRTAAAVLAAVKEGASVDGEAREGEPYSSVEERQWLAQERQKVWVALDMEKALAGGDSAQIDPIEATASNGGSEQESRTPPPPPVPPHLSWSARDREAPPLVPTVYEPEERERQGRVKYRPPPPPPPPPEPTFAALSTHERSRSTSMQRDDKEDEGFQDLAQSRYSMTDSEYTKLSGSEDMDSDRWSVLSTGPVDRQWTVVYTEKDEVV